MIGRTEPPERNPAFDTVVEGLLKLHELMVAGRGDTPEADAVRDELDAPLAELSPEEYERTRWLSEDLYSVIEPSTRSEPKPITPAARVALAKADTLRHTGEPDVVLELWRRWREYIDAATLSSRRCSLWRDLGYPAVAAIFDRHARELESANPSSS